jgi:hypothetical protein
VNSDGSVTSQQVLNTPSTYNGMVWAPDGSRFYVSGGANDRVLVFRFDGKQYATRVSELLCVEIEASAS